MAKAESLSYESLFAALSPAPQDGGPVRRAKYDFAVAYPDPDSLPLDGLADGLARALREEGRDLAIYPDRSGYRPLRELVADKLAADRNIRIAPEDVVIGAGSSQPIQLVAEVLVDPGDVVLTEDFVYSGTLSTLRRFRADVRGVECDGDGMLPDALEAAILRAKGEGRPPKMVYTIPTFQNPQGWTATLERRQAMLDLSRKHRVPILEDDCYVDLRYDGEDVTSIRSLDDSDHVMYVASFSKIIAPGARIGYLVAPPDVLDRARAAKGGGGASQFTSLAIHRYAAEHLKEHVDEINRVQRAKRDAMMAALGENLGSEAEWSRPEGGLYLWLTIRNREADLEALRETAMDADVGYLPGPNFAPDGVSGKNKARLCFGYNTPSEIHEGIARLAEVLEREGLLGS